MTTIRLSRTDYADMFKAFDACLESNVIHIEITNDDISFLTSTTFCPFASLNCHGIHCFIVDVQDMKFFYGVCGPSTYDTLPTTLYEKIPINLSIFLIRVHELYKKQTSINN